MDRPTQLEAILSPLRTIQTQENTCGEDPLTCLLGPESIKAEGARGQGHREDIGVGEDPGQGAHQDDPTAKDLPGDEPGQDPATADGPGPSLVDDPLEDGEIRETPETDDEEEVPPQVVRRRILQARPDRSSLQGRLEDRILREQIKLRIREAAQQQTVKLPQLRGAK